jgi:hypothetical protein
MLCYRVRPASLCSDLHTLYDTTSQSSDHHRARRQLSDDELVAGSNDNKEKYKSKYGRQLSEDELVAGSNDNKEKYKSKYGRQLSEDELVAGSNDNKEKYKSKYGRQLSDDELVAGSNDNKEKYKSKYGRELPDQTHAADSDDDRLLHPFRDGKSVLHNSNQSRIAAIARSIYDEMYTDAKIGSRKPSQQNMFNTISGQNLGNLLVKEWLELPLADSERHFLAEWESELVVRTAALGIYCIQGKAKHAPITEIRDLLLMKAK